MPPKRKWSSSEKREVGFRQQWRCAHCANLLPATYEVDHVKALHNGGEDCLETNAEALCNTCHAAKTLRERVKWERRRTEAILNAKREDAPPQKPLQGNRSLLDAKPAPVEFLANRFLKFAFVRVKP